METLFGNTQESRSQFAAHAMTVVCFAYRMQQVRLIRETHSGIVYNTVKE